MTRELYEQCRNLPTCKLKTGVDNTEQIKTHTMLRPAGGHLLLCSDGFWAEKEELLTGTPAQCLEVIRRAIPDLRNTAADNFSIMVVVIQMPPSLTALAFASWPPYGPI